MQIYPERFLNSSPHLFSLSFECYFHCLKKNAISYGQGLCQIRTIELFFLKPLYVGNRKHSWSWVWVLILGNGLGKQHILPQPSIGAYPTNTQSAPNTMTTTKKSGVRNKYKVCQAGCGGCDDLTLATTLRAASPQTRFSNYLQNQNVKYATAWRNKAHRS